MTLNPETTDRGDTRKSRSISPSVSPKMDSVKIVTCDNKVESGEDSDDNYDEPLGYQDFLYDVNIEYSPGGTRSSPIGHKYCFKMKRLPYMVTYNHHTPCQDSSMGSSSSDIASCDREDLSENNILDDQMIDLTNLTKMMQIDVTKETCAFLGNSDFVPSPKKKMNRVAIELVSAKLSQSSGYHIPPNSSLTNLTVLAENQTAFHTSTDASSLNSYTSHSSGTSNHDSKAPTNPTARVKITPSPPPSSPSSSRKFVNYTILIKTIPGLDKHPAVIERRFSDFLNLYQGLKNEKAYSEIIENHVMFPKKVYMGNFSLEKIAERSIEFARLLHVCVVNSSLTWSVPFISFLIDKELKEAHRLSLFGDPDDVQALIENAYYIEQKLYFRPDSLSRSTSSSDSINSPSHNTSPALPNRRFSTLLNRSRNIETISTDRNVSTPTMDGIQTHEANSNESSPISSNSLNNSNGCRNNNIFKECLTPINQRILVTFCMLFVTYCRSQNHQGLKQVADEFTLLISSQEYIDSLVNTRHYNSLRACLLFLMNLNHKHVVDDNFRQFLKRKLEDIDGIHAELAGNLHCSMSTNSPASRRYSLRGASNSLSPSGRASRVTKKDLTSLLRERNFCSFQDGKFGKK